MLSRQWNNISFILNPSQASSLIIYMENSETLGIQFKPTKALKPDFNSDESWETYSSAEGDPSTAKEAKQCISWYWYMWFKCSQMPATKECLCCHEINASDYFKIKVFAHLFTYNSENFLD